jgi:hypothetical protein
MPIDALPRRKARAPRKPRRPRLRVLKPEPAPEPDTPDAAPLAPYCPPPYYPPGAFADGPQPAWSTIQQQIRRELWAYCATIRYNPLQAMIQQAVDPGTPPDIAHQNHKTVAQYLLPTLRGVTIEGHVTHEHSGDVTIRTLFERLEEEDARAHEDLPMWTPPGLDMLDMHRLPDGAWDMDEETPDDPAS